MAAVFSGKPHTVLFTTFKFFCTPARKTTDNTKKYYFKSKAASVTSFSDASRYGWAYIAPMELGSWDADSSDLS